LQQTWAEWQTFLFLINLFIFYRADDVPMGLLNWIA
jgi:hypothetical protein